MNESTWHFLVYKSGLNLQFRLLQWNQVERLILVVLLVLVLALMLVLLVLLLLLLLLLLQDQ